MKPGPRKTPSVIAQLRGNPGRRAINQAEPKPERALLKCPPELSRRAKAEWRRIAPALFRLGLLAEVYRAPLAAYCASYARWIEAEKMMNTAGAKVTLPNGKEIPVGGMVDITPNGLAVKSVWLTIANKEAELMRKFASEFGMSPSAMTGLSVDRGADDADTGDDWDRLGRTA